MTADYYIIRLERFNQGMTQKQLADKAEISLSALIKAEHGKNISATTNGKIRRALGLNQG